MPEIMQLKKLALKTKLISLVGRLITDLDRLQVRLTRLITVIANKCIYTLLMLTFSSRRIVRANFSSL